MSVVARTLKGLARAVTPPFALHIARTLAGMKPKAEYRLLGENWAAAQAQITAAGWSDVGPIRYYQNEWAGFLADPLAQSGQQNVYYLSVANALQIAAARRTTAEPVSVLDWGGSFGHYAVVLRQLCPDLTLDYHCFDVPAMAQVGRELQPDVKFYSAVSELPDHFDFVFASSSLQYSPDWRDTLGLLVRVARHGLCLSRVPLVVTSPSFVDLQEAYGTQYAGWCLNREELLAQSKLLGLTVDFEVLQESGLRVGGIEEQPQVRAFAFGLSAPALAE